MSLREAMCRWSLAQRVVNVVVGGLAMVGCCDGAQAELSAALPQIEAIRKFRSRAG